MAPERPYDSLLISTTNRRCGAPAMFQWPGLKWVAMDQRRSALAVRIDALRHELANRIGVHGYGKSLAKSIASRTDEAIATASQGTQILLAMAYQDRAERGAPLPPFDEVEFRVYSQNSEDG